VGDAHLPALAVFFNQFGKALLSARDVTETHQGLQ
jgi:hypothetical protein